MTQETLGAKWSNHLSCRYAQHDKGDSKGGSRRMETHNTWQRKGLCSKKPKLRCAKKTGKNKLKEEKQGLLSIN